MPRPKKPGAGEPKRRSRNGCWNCKARKVKCDEAHPTCVNCQRTGEACDYSIRLNWEGRKKKNPGFETILFQTPSESSSSSNRNPRRPSDSKSSSSVATTSRATDNHASPSATSPGAGGNVRIPRSEPKAKTPTQPSLRPIVFTGQPVAPATDDEEPPSLCSPDLASPIFSLPRSHANAVPGGYVAISEASQPGTARPPPHKRLRYSVDLDAPHQLPQISSPVSITDPASAAATPRFLSSSAAIVPAGSFDSPLTPAASSPYSEDGLARAPGPRQTALPSPDTHRMSVSSLLSGPPGPAGPVHYAPPSQRTVNARENLCLSDVTTYYGLDPGFPDLDLGPNDDAHGIMDLQSKTLFNIEPKDAAPTDDTSTGGTIRGKDRESSGRRGYYEQPLQVRIPRDLEPLPAKLLENPMNLLYFHHFMNHTAKALVPHDDEQSNPYRHVLPQMAVKNDNLLSLMLAYAASHRAHVLGHPEPATRIAHWVQDIFPALRNALNDPNQSISNANIATGIMLASLEIVSPTAFGVAIPWQRHLGLARELINSRPDGIRWGREWTEEDQVRAFLWSWLAYLDVLGTLSGGRGESSTAWILEYQKDEYEEEWDEIDCIMGMTTRGVYFLAQVAELAKECDALRASEARAGAGGGGEATAAAAAAAAGRSGGSSSSSRTTTTAWQPPTEILHRAWTLEANATDSMSRPPQPCKHLHASGNVARWERHEITALNEAFHWAGLVHLHRRVLERPRGHADVQAAVLKIHTCLDVVPLGGHAEASMLFPLFTAACETAPDDDNDDDDDDDDDAGGDDAGGDDRDHDGGGGRGRGQGTRRRARVRERMDSMRRSGFLQVERARALVERVWETGQPWEALLTNEFIG